MVGGGRGDGGRGRGRLNVGAGRRQLEAVGGRARRRRRRLQLGGFDLCIRAVGFGPSNDDNPRSSVAVAKRLQKDYNMKTEGEVCVKAYIIISGPPAPSCGDESRISFCLCV